MALGEAAGEEIIFAMAPVRMWRLERRPARREEEEVGQWERRRQRAVRRSEE